MPGHDVGYKKPPAHTRFKKGHSGNPKGRPRKGKNGMGEALLWALEYIVTVYESGKPKQMTARQAIVRQRIHEAAKGDLRAINDVILLMKVPGDYQEEIYVWAGDWGVPYCPDPDETKHEI